MPLLHNPISLQPGMTRALTVQGGLAAAAPVGTLTLLPPLLQVNIAPVAITNRWHLQKGKASTVYGHWKRVVVTWDTDALPLPQL